MTAAAALALPLMATTLAPSEAGAAVRCTIVGTSGADRLVGTPRRDVICGGGGNDYILGGGGDDLVYGGPGADRIYGGAGTDRLLGGSSDDIVSGGDGSDTALGGPGKDRLTGGPGNDRLAGEDANDVADGGAGTDTVLGGDGNDDLAGGTSADTIDGGAGTNWCQLDAADVANRCVYDKTPGAADNLTASTSSIDVTLAHRSVTFRVHVTDDTGVDDVLIGPGEDTPWFPGTMAKLVSGDVRNGWWTATVTVRRWSMPGTYVPVVEIWDRLHRQSETPFPAAGVEVLDATPDTVKPEVTLLSPDPTTAYDVRTAAAKVTIRARIVDEVSGVGNISMSIWAPRVNGAGTEGFGDNITLTSGTGRDGIWTGTIMIPKGQVGGDWSVAIAVSDRAHLDWKNVVRYWGPGEYEAYQGDLEKNRPFPYGMGSINVIGRLRTDSAPPVLSSATVSPATVDTLAGPAAVHVSLQATDAGSGIDGMNVTLVPAVEEDNLTWHPSMNPHLASGTIKDGTWTGTINLPQGLPPGTYYLRVYLWDRETNSASYISSGHPDAAYWSNTIADNPMVTVVDSTP